MSGDAHGDANPILLIDENDVVAGHAASVGPVDPEQMYYLMSRGIDRATDVISFAIEDDDDLANLPAEIRAELPVELGDLVISIDKVTEQALFLNHSADRELGYLLVHGFLHLNGYDHEEPADEKKMFTLQEEILDGLGLSR